MQLEEIIKLTSVLYNVAEAMPNDEPLSYEMKKQALKVLAGCSLVDLKELGNKTQDEKAKKTALSSIEILLTYFQLASQRNFLRRENFEVLARYYNEIKRDLASSKTKEPEAALVLPEKKAKPLVMERKVEKVEKKERNKINPEILKKPRHKKIMQEFVKKGALQVKDLEKILPSITKRTIRRDMTYLMALGLLERNGDKSSTFYKIKS